MRHFKLSFKHYPTSEKEKQEMRGVPYVSIVDTLMYAMVCTRLDIACAVGVVSLFLSNPGKEYWITVKWILRYIKDTSRVCLYFGGDKPVLQVYTDTDMAEDVNSRKSFAVKNLGLAKQILGMKISRDRKVGKLWLSQEACS